MSVDLDRLGHTARLARLRLEPSRVEVLLQQMQRIVHMVEQLQELDITDVPPTKHVIDLVNVDRNDTPTPSLPVESVMEMAPESADSEFVVPRILPR